MGALWCGPILGARGLAVTSLLLGQVTGAGWSGSRPAECAPLESATASNVWERAKSPALRRYCDLLASGAAKLAGGAPAGAGADDAREAMAIADEASRALPGRAAPGVLRGRALARLGRWAEAVTAFGEAKAADEHALDDPAALFAWGRALGRVGRVEDAEAAFRALLPRTSALAPAEHGRAEIEAALLAERRGPAGLDEAIALLRQAQRDAQDVLQTAAGIALALALDRAGQHEESRVALTLGPSRDPRAVLADPRALDALADADALPESDALAALALGDRDPSTARELWSKYLAGPGGKGPWADHARARAHGRATTRAHSGGDSPR